MIYNPLFEQVQQELKSKTLFKIQNFLRTIQYEVSDYEGGYCNPIGDKKRIEKIGKVLNRHDRKDLLSEFSNDYIRQLSKVPLIELDSYSKKTPELSVLFDFIKMSISDSTPIFEKFKTLPRAVFHESGTHPKERFVYVEGTREDKVLLVAHADTVWDSYFINKSYDSTHKPAIRDNTIISTSHQHGIGADDRCGVAMVWLMKDMGHSLLIVDGEERGAIGSNFLVDDHPELIEKINKEHRFAVEFDRRNAKEFKCYDVGTPEFRAYVTKETGYTEPDRMFFTDICTLCTSVCGVNISVGYYNEHTAQEMVNLDEWLASYNLAKKWLEKQQPERFELPPIVYPKYSYKRSSFGKRYDAYDDLDWDADDVLGLAGGYPTTGKTGITNWDDFSTSSYNSSYSKSDTTTGHSTFKSFLSGNKKIKRETYYALREELPITVEEFIMDHHYLNYDLTKRAAIKLIDDSKLEGDDNLIRVHKYPWLLLLEDPELGVQDYGLSDEELQEYFEEHEEYFMSSVIETYTVGHSGDGDLLVDPTDDDFGLLALLY
jgi:hypothetical protein